MPAVECVRELCCPHLRVSSSFFQDPFSALGIYYGELAVTPITESCYKNAQMQFKTCPVSPHFKYPMHVGQVTFFNLGKRRRGRGGGDTGNCRSKVESDQNHRIGLVDPDPPPGAARCRWTRPGGGPRS